MTEMISYLSNYREETPAWIGSYLPLINNLKLNILIKAI